MKKMMFVFTFLSFVFCSQSFAEMSDMGLKSRIETMISVIENGESNLAVQKMIVTGAAKALSESNIKDEDLTSRVKDAVYSVSPTLTKREEAILNRYLAKLK